MNYKHRIMIFKNLVNALVWRFAKCIRAPKKTLAPWRKRLVATLAGDTSKVHPSPLKNDITKLLKEGHGAGKLIKVIRACC